MTNEQKHEKYRLMFENAFGKAVNGCLKSAKKLSILAFYASEYWERWQNE